MSFLRRLSIAGCCLAAVTASPSLAQQAGFQDLDALDAVIATALGAQVGEEGGAAHRLDRRLRLTNCAQSVTVSEPRAGAVTVACGGNGWQLRVAVRQANRRSSSATSTETGDPVIRRGDEVQLVVVGSGFQVSTRAVADQSARAGDRVRIRIPSRPGPVYGIVMADGRVRL